MILLQEGQMPTIKFLSLMPDVIETFRGDRLVDLDVKVPTKIQLRTCTKL